MIQLDEKRLAKLEKTHELLDKKYGEHGTSAREPFNEKQWHDIMAKFQMTGVKSLS